jgi:hypothetical protein
MESRAGQRLSGWLSDPASSGPAVDGAVVVTVSPDEVIVTPRDGLPFVPVAREAPASTDAFSTIEAMEFGENQLATATERYRVLSRDRDAHVRAGALLRLGRVLRKSRDFSGALAAYQQLSLLGAVRTDDLPAELAGLDGQRAALLGLEDREGARRVGAHLLQGLDSGRWLITRGAAEFYRDDVSTASRPDSVAARRRSERRVARRRRPPAGTRAARSAGMVGPCWCYGDAAKAAPRF